jgi:hypothetical protein
MRRWGKSKVEGWGGDEGAEKMNVEHRTSNIEL